MEIGESRFCDPISLSARYLRWIEMNVATQANIPVKLWEVVEEEESKVLAAFNEAVSAIRTPQRNTKAGSIG